jgi:hypothetical protein
MSNIRDAWELFDQWQSGDQSEREAAASELFHRYAEALQLLVRPQIVGNMQRRFRPSDVVASAFKSFFCRQRESQGQDRDDPRHTVWGLLVTLTMRKLIDKQRAHLAEKRDIRREEHLIDGICPSSLLRASITREPSPQEATVTFNEILEGRLAKRSPRDQTIICLWLHEPLEYEEISNEIAGTEYACGERSVRRVVEEFISEVTKLWKTQNDSDEEHGS